MLQNKVPLTVHAGIVMGGLHLITLQETILIAFPVPPELRRTMHAQMLPMWRQELRRHPVRTKLMVSNGKFRHLRALPIAVVSEFVNGWKDAAMARLRQEASELQAQLEAYDAATAADGDGEAEDEVYDDGL